MSEAVRFLHALAQALSTFSLYSPGHPATRRAVELAWQALQPLLAVVERPTYLFLGAAPVFDGRALHELSEWPWSRRLFDIQVQRIEFDARLSNDGMEAFLDRLMVRFNNPDVAPPEEAPIDGVAFGGASVLESEAAEEAVESQPVVEGSEELQVDLSDELEAMAYVRTEAVRGVVARAEADAVVRILGSLLDDHQYLQASAGHARYFVVHAVNTALLAMSATTLSGMDRSARHRVGFAALMHDIGLARIPPGLTERESLSESDRAVVETHTIEGARLLLERGGVGASLASTVAFEHHLRPDGSGYPSRRFRVPPHWASRLVGVASSFVALRSPRPFRPAWRPDRVISYVEDGAGSVFDAEAARLLIAVVKSD